MSKIQFRLATVTDLPAVMGIVAEARQFLHDRGIPQWQDGYPDQQIFEQDISRQALYVGILDQQVVMMLTLLSGPDPNYAKIDDAWQQSSDQYLVMHRIALTRTVSGQGLAKSAFKFAIQTAQQQHKVSLRIDTHEKNRGMRHLAMEFKMKDCGTVWMADGAPRVAYELVF